MFLRLILLLALLGANLLSTQSLRAEQSAPVRIAIFGDSITRATIADIELGTNKKIGDAISVGVRNTILGLTVPVLLEDENVLHTELMQRVDYGARDELAFTQGSMPYSIRSRLEAQGHEVEIMNFAKLGGSFRQGDAQLSAMQKALATQEPPDLIIVDFGRIDLSLFTSAADFKSQATNFFKILTQLSPHARILVTEVANIPAVIYRPDSIVGSLPVIGPVRCSQVLEALKLARKLDLKPGTTNEAQYKLAVERWRSYNQSLSELVSNYQERGLKIRLAAPLQPRAKPEDWDQILAIDCIHLNSQGHAEIAESLWPSVEALLAEPPSELQAAATPQLSGISPRGRELWAEYLAKLPLADLQPQCQPRIVPPTTEYRGVVVLFHGFSACPQQYLELADLLAARGFSVVLPLLPGHGRQWLGPAEAATDQTSDLPTGLLTDPNNYRRGYNGFVSQMNRIAEQFDGTRVVGGLSMGGTLASLATIERADIWDRQIIMVPYYEIGEALSRNLIGSVANSTTLIPRLSKALSPLLQSESGWGKECERERYVPTVGRAGICQFKFTHLLASNQVGFETWSLLRPTMVQTQFVLIEEDFIINSQLAFNGVGRMRHEKLYLPPYQSRVRFDNDPTVRICYLPSKQSICLRNATIPPAEQPVGCVNHSLLSRFDKAAQNKYWLDTLLPKLVDFAADGTYFSQDPDRRVDGDPSCADFPAELKSAT